jgi:site-specific DNA recombinase
MNVAIYARKSTEQPGVSEDAKSVTRQVERARAYAAAEGWTVTAVFVDDAVSGTEFDAARRPGLARLLAAVRLTPRAFDGLVMSEESRLGRESIETLYALKCILTAGCRVFYYLDKRERPALHDPLAKIQAQVLAFVDEMEHQRSSTRTHDALLARAQRGQVTGGRTFGYQNQAVLGPDGRRSHVARVIDETEAAVVREIFARCAAGHGLRTIARQLNDEGAVAPMPRRAGRPRGWAPSSVREVLYRQLYRGVLQWNRTQKRDAWGVKRQQDRPTTAWVETTLPRPAHHLGGGVDPRPRPAARRARRLSAGDGWRHAWPTPERRRVEVSADRVRHVRAVRRKPPRPEPRVRGRAPPCLCLQRVLLPGPGDL